MGGSTSYVRDYEEEKKIQARYEVIINEQNARLERERADWDRRDEQVKQYWEQMRKEWQKEKDEMKREAEARIKKESDLFNKAQEERLRLDKKMDEELRNAREEHDAKLKEIEGRSKREQAATQKLEEEMRVIRDETVARNKQEREGNEKRRKEVEELLKQQEKEKARMDKERKENIEATEREMRATREQREELQRQIKKAQEEEEKRKEREAEREAQQAELNKQRDGEIRIAKEEAEKEAKARKKAEEEREKAEDDLKKGIRPEMIPTEKDIQEVKAKLQYTDDHFHFAICGSAGSGKSSLINALRGMKNTDPMAAKTGVVETTQSIGRYPDMDRRPPRAWIVWYDIPGAGTMDIPDWQYFNDQGLFIFDLIILAVGDRLSTIDIWIIKNCRRFSVPCFIVRSKSDQHIRNVAKGELEYDSDDEDQDHKAIKEQARRTFIGQTRQSFASILAKENLPSQRTYIISAQSMCSYINGKPKSMIDERDLVEDLLQAAYSRVEIAVAE